MLCDVGEPDPIRAISGEPQLHQVIVSDGVGVIPALGRMTGVAIIRYPRQAWQPFTTEPKTQTHP